MVYNTQNHWVYGLCLSSRILNNLKKRFRNWIWLHLPVGVGGHLICWVPYKALTSITICNRVDISLPSPEDGNKSSFQNVVFSSYLVFQMMDKVHKLNYSEYLSTLLVLGHNQAYCIMKNVSVQNNIWRRHFLYSKL
jgi:hypothetical protein